MCRFGSERASIEASARKATQAMHDGEVLQKRVVCLENSHRLHELPLDSLRKMQMLLEWHSKYADRINSASDPDGLLRD
jgi:hypothetical protein